MDIYILNKNNRKIQDKLERELPGYNMRVFPTVESFYEYVTHTAVLADMFIITDGGITRDDGVEVSSSFSVLHKLFEYEYFDPKTTVFLNKADNLEHKSKYEFLQKKLIEKGKDVSLISKNIVEVDDLRDIITQSTITFKPRVTNQKAVVQVKRGARTLSTKVLPTYSTDETIAIALHKIDTVSQIVKENHKDNKTPLTVEDESANTIEELPSDFDITFQEVKPEYRHVKYIAVTGDGGTGVSTTALTLALNGCLEDRTLLIDADTYLGLSNLVENVLPANHFYNIDLERILIDKDDAISDVLNSDNMQNLHIMTITLPTIRAVGMDAMEYMILNLLTLIQDNYKYIIIDLPFRVINQYATLLSKADVIMASCPPYLNKVVGLLGAVKRSEIIQSTKAYKDGLFMTYMTGMPDLNGFNPISIKEFTVYADNFLQREVPCINPYICMDNQYVAQDRFRAIIDRADMIFNKKGE